MKTKNNNGENTEEIWRDIKGFENKYQVSNKGNVRSLNYNNTNKPQNLKQKINKCGFCEVKLSKYNKAKDYMVARLVAEAFIPNNKRCDLVINIDNNKTNNTVENLKWVYTSEAKYLVYKKGNRKGKASKYKITINNKKYKGYSDIAKRNNMKPKDLHRRLNQGWGIEEAISIKVDKKNQGKKPYYYEYYGKIISSEKIAKINNINVKLLNQRLARGWNIYEAAEIKKGEK